MWERQRVEHSQCDHCCPCENQETSLVGEYFVKALRVQHSREIKTNTMFITIPYPFFAVCFCNVFVNSYITKVIVCVPQHLPVRYHSWNCFGLTVWLSFQNSTGISLTILHSTFSPASQTWFLPTDLPSEIPKHFSPIYIVLLLCARNCHSLHGKCPASACEARPLSPAWKARNQSCSYQFIWFSCSPF